MTTISNNRRKKFNLRTFVSVFILCLVVAVIFFFRMPLGGIVWSVLAPVMHMRLSASDSAGVFFSSFGSNYALAEENKRLREALASTSILVMDRELLRKENVELKLRLGRPQETAPLLAAVLLAPPGTPYDTLVIDVGKSQGVKEGDLVAAEGSVYIGKVSNVFDTTSRVVLLSSPGQTYQTLLRGTIPLALIGQGGGSLRGEVPAGMEVRVGDTVTIPSITPEYTARVAGVSEREGESFKSVYLELPANPYSLRFVEVHIQHQ